MSRPGYTIRTVETEAEREAFFQTMCLADSEAPYPPDPTEYTRWYEWLQRRSALTRITLRAAFQDSTCLGTYVMADRVLLLGPARLITGCIGDVATLPAFRRQGIASALMHDAIAQAKQAHYHLLLLVGIQNFYRRFGYTNITDYPVQIIALDDLAKQPPSPYSVRSATDEDSYALLELYQRHFNRFERSLALQAEYLRDRLDGKPPWLACDEAGKPQGYLIYREAGDPSRAQEVAANNWHATLALLHHHAEQLKSLPEAPTQLRWPRPFDPPSSYEIADHLPVQWDIYSTPDGDWMGYITDLPGVIRSLETVWQQRWQRAGRAWSGRLTQQIGYDAFTLEMTESKLRLLESVDLQAPTLHLHPSTFTKLLFGWRPIGWALNQQDTVIPHELIALAEILYPMERIWFPPTDEF